MKEPYSSTIVGIAFFFQMETLHSLNLSNIYNINSGHYKSCFLPFWKPNSTLDTAEHSFFIIFYLVDGQIISARILADEL